MTIRIMLNTFLQLFFVFKLKLQSLAKKCISNKKNPVIQYLTILSSMTRRVYV